MMVYENYCLNKAKLLPKSSPNGNGKIKALGLMTFAAVDVNIPVQYHFYFALCDCNNFYCKCFARSNKLHQRKSLVDIFTFRFCSLLPQSLTKSRSAIYGWFSKKSLGNVLNNSRVDILTPADNIRSTFCSVCILSAPQVFCILSALSAGFLHRQNDVGIRIFVRPGLLNSAKQKSIMFWCSFHGFGDCCNMIFYWNKY